jgi:hypothetical protein
MLKQITLGACALMLCSAWAEAPPAPPSKDGAMQFVGSKNGRGYFIAKDGVQRTGDRIALWTLMADTHTTNVEGHMIVAAWAHEIADCKARTLGGDRLVMLDEALAPAGEDNSVDAPKAVVAGSLGEERLDLMCSGKTPRSGGPVVSGLAGAREFVRTHL